MKRVAMLCCGLVLCSAQVNAKSKFYQKIGSAFKKVGEGIVGAAEVTYEKVLEPAGEHIAGCAKVTGLGIAIGGAEAGLYTAQGVLKTAEGFVIGSGFMGEQLGKLGGSVLNIEKITFETRATSIARGELITLNLSGVFFGKHVDDLKLPFDVKKGAQGIAQGVEEAVKAIGQLVGKK